MEVLEMVMVGGRRRFELDHRAATSSGASANAAPDAP